MQIVTRDSFLALAQTLTVSEMILKAGGAVKINALKTQGDLKLHDPLYKVSKEAATEKEGRAFFTKELEDGLLSKNGDLAVHSLKDLPTDLPEGLELSHIMLPEDKSDTFVTFEPLPENPELQSRTLSKATIGTSSLRRIALLKHYFPESGIVPVRGNLITRIQKLLDKTDGISVLLLATSGLKRLLEFHKNWPEKKVFWESKISLSIIEKLDADYKKLNEIFKSTLYFYSIQSDAFIPPVGQGTLGIEMRKNDHANKSNLSDIINEDVKRRKLLDFERTILHKLGSGCHVPFGLSASDVCVDIKNKIICERNKEDCREDYSAYKTRAFFALGFDPAKEENINSFFAIRYFNQSNYDKNVDTLIEELNGEKFPVIYTGKNSRDLQQELKNTKHPFFHLPLIETRYIEVENLANDKNYDALVISSMASLESKAFAEITVPNTIVAIGEKTAAMTKKKFPEAEIITPDIYNAISAAKLIEEKKYSSVLWSAARGGITDGVEYLRAQNIEVEVLTLYESVEKKADDASNIWEEKNLTKEIFLQQKAFWVFCSPSAVSSYFNQGLSQSPHIIACLGATTAEVFLKRGNVPYIISSKSTLTQMGRDIKGENQITNLKLTNWNYTK
ncbi:MAG: uroporphyrinogen-III synthase [Spirochaetia bacterium]|nr:uroporphyrinogen-III synthase [Spirochaetia bacterium]